MFLGIENAFKRTDYLVICKKKIETNFWHYVKNVNYQDETWFSVQDKNWQWSSIPLQILIIFLTSYFYDSVCLAVVEIKITYHTQSKWSKNNHFYCMITPFQKVYKRFIHRKMIYSLLFTEILIYFNAYFSKFFVYFFTKYSCPTNYCSSWIYIHRWVKNIVAVIHNLMFMKYVYAKHYRNIDTFIS